MSASLRDIAEQCGCSRTVVSSVLNNKKAGTTRCSVEKAREIRRVAEEIGYSLPQSRGGRSLALHVLTLYTELNKQSQAEQIVLKTLSSSLIEENVFINPIWVNDPDLESKLVSFEESFERSFFLLLHFHPEKTLKVLERFECPSIFINPIHTFPSNCILPDDAQGCAQALKLLKSYDVKRVIYVDNTGNHHQSNALRKAEFVDKCPEQGIAVTRVLDLGEIKENPLILKTANKDCDVIVTYEDCGAFLTSILKCFEIRVPEDIGVLNLGGSDFMEMSTPSTYVDIPFKRMSEIAANILLKMIYSNKYEFNNILVPEGLVIGDSLRSVK